MHFSFVSYIISHASAFVKLHYRIFVPFFVIKLINRRPEFMTLRYPTFIAFMEQWFFFIEIRKQTKELLFVCTILYFHIFYHQTHPLGEAWKRYNWWFVIIKEQSTNAQKSDRIRSNRKWTSLIHQFYLLTNMNKKTYSFLPLFRQFGKNKKIFRIYATKGVHLGSIIIRAFES